MADGPVAILTGASRGMGTEIARWLAKAGARITLVARSADPLEEIAEKINHTGGEGLPFSADISEQTGCNEAIRKTMDRFGRLDVLINNAGLLGPIAPVADADPDAWRYNIEVNLLGPFFLTHAALPHLRAARGRVVNISSGAAVKSIRGWSAYCVAKAGLTHFTRVLAEEEPDVISVAVRPGVVDTRMQEMIREEGPGAMSEDKVNYFQTLKSENKLEPPYVPARSVAWLALYAPQEMNGKFVEYDDSRIADPAVSVFGETIESSAG